MINNRRVSIATGSLNRLEALRQSLSTWLRTTEPDEIVIVDWNNPIPLQESLKDFDDSRIKISRVIDQSYWQWSKCHNLELQLVSGDILLRLDNDCLLGKDFFDRHPLDPGVFYAGYWDRVPADSHDKIHLAGTVYAYRADLLAINGYNERLVHYGYDDDDLYDRLVKSGLRRLDVDLSTLDHIAHSDQDRLKNIRISPSLSRVTDGMDVATRRLRLTMMNMDSAKRKPWSSRDKMTTWQNDGRSNYVVSGGTSEDDEESIRCCLETPRRFLDSKSKTIFAFGRDLDVSDESLCSLFERTRIMSGLASKANNTEG